MQEVFLNGSKHSYRSEHPECSNVIIYGSKHFQFFFYGLAVPIEERMLDAFKKIEGKLLKPKGEERVSDIEAKIRSKLSRGFSAELKEVTGSASLFRATIESSYVSKKKTDLFV